MSGEEHECVFVEEQEPEGRLILPPCLVCGLPAMDARATSQRDERRRAMNCKCDDERHDLGTALWHRAYCNWYDAREAGRSIRAAAWGFVADRLCRFA